MYKAQIPLLGLVVNVLYSLLHNASTTSRCKWNLGLIMLWVYSVFHVMLHLISYLLIFTLLLSLSVCIVMDVVLWFYSSCW